MYGVRAILTGLFAQVISEYGQEAPALADLSIERVSERFEPHLVAQFSNRHRASAPIDATDFSSFCDTHAAWDMESLRAALLHEGHEIYAQMFGKRMDDNRAREDGVAVVGRPNADDENHLRGDPSFWRRSRSTLEAWLPHVSDRPRFLGPRTDRKAQARGMRLLAQNLSPAQRQQHETCGCFEVIGGATGKRYRIKNGHQMNVEELDAKGRRVRVLCFMPEGGLVTGDILLAQKLALELFECEARAAANIMPAHHLSRYHRLAQWG